MALIVTGLLLWYSFREHTAHHYEEHVSMHLEELITASGFSPEGSFELAFRPSDPRFHILHSGWYWEVKQSGETLKRSPSLGESNLDIGNLQPTGSVMIHEIVGPIQEWLRVLLIEIEVDPERDPLVLLASAPMTGIKDDVQGYSRHIIGSFVVLGIGLMLAVVLQVRIAIQPLTAISTGISNVREGKAAKLPDDNLEDVQPLVDELNNLLDHNAVLLRRARNQLGDLAHSVKNPLSVINNETRNMEPAQKDLILQQTNDISKSVDHYLSRARTFGTEKVLGSRSGVKSVVEDLVYAMQRIYQEKNLVFDYSHQIDYWFKGEGQDLEEMLGNLMDNACKWAISKVLIHCSVENDNLVLTIEDDGPGIPEKEFENVVDRGLKLDDSKPGHGQGLGIVKDIADLYGGSLRLDKSRLGGLKAELTLPAT